MPWTHAVVLLYFCQPLPCDAGDVYRFPPPVHNFVRYDQAEGETDNYERGYFEAPGMEARLAYLRAMRAWDAQNFEYWGSLVSAQEQSASAWYHLAAARFHVRRKNYGTAVDYLGRLREIIGEQAYVAGVMPAPIQ